MDLNPYAQQAMNQARQMRNRVVSDEFLTSRPGRLSLAGAGILAGNAVGGMVNSGLEMTGLADINPAITGFAGSMAGYALADELIKRAMARRGMA